MTLAIIIILLCLLLIVAGLFLWRARDHRADRAEIDRLRRLPKTPPPVFSYDMLKNLPDPVKRYFQFTIKEGTPLHKAAEISMQGHFGLGDKTTPKYLPMTAKQVLAAPEGFIWKMSGGSGLMQVSGSDSANWTRFWLAGILPVARAGGTKDHQLSAFARAVAEAVFWTPAAVLPGPGIHWDAENDTTARLTLEHGGMRQSVTITLTQDGQPIRVTMQRWSNANVDHQYRFQPFGGDLSVFKEFHGFTLPTHIEAGNLIGTKDYFPFFIADVTDLQLR
jgi:hypothetical protein